MADPIMHDILSELAALRATVGDQGARLARYEHRRQRRRHRRPLLAVGLFIALLPLSLLAATPFNDLTGGVHDANIDAIYNAGVTTGCVPNVSYCPTATVTREEMASFLARLGGLGSNPPAANARTLQGYAPNGLVRVAGGFRPLDPVDLPKADTSYHIVGTVKLIVPGPGFVVVSGSASYGLTEGGTNARVKYQLRRVASPGGTHTTQWVSLTTDARIQSAGMVTVFHEASGGEQAYVLEAGYDSGASSAIGTESEMFAIFIPFGPVGDQNVGFP